jgi:hypothetical protein
MLWMDLAVLWLYHYIIHIYMEGAVTPMDPYYTMILYVPSTGLTLHDTPFLYPYTNTS